MSTELFTSCEYVASRWRLINSFMPFRVRRGYLTRVLDENDFASLGERIIRPGRVWDNPVLHETAWKSLFLPEPNNIPLIWVFNELPCIARQPCARWSRQWLSRHQRRAPNDAINYACIDVTGWRMAGADWLKQITSIFSQSRRETMVRSCYLTIVSRNAFSSTISWESSTPLETHFRKPKVVLAVALRSRHATRVHLAGIFLSRSYISWD